MRTTVTLDPDVEHYIRETCHRRKASFKRVLNETLREALKPASTRQPELLAPKSMGHAPGVDPRRLSELADELEAEAFLAAESARAYGNHIKKQ
ncbi:MAG: antitoxin [Verrucomicrobia bacterium]|jgi:hypothetical protein|nr:antitoxin [Verrucomicrobiota bacterium]